MLMAKLSRFANFNIFDNFGGPSFIIRLMVVIHGTNIFSIENSSHKPVDSAILDPHKPLDPHWATLDPDWAALDPSRATLDPDTGQQRTHTGQHWILTGQ
jgi:hypothetical protein